jgi:glutamate carboxypeptidase
VAERLTSDTAPQRGSLDAAAAVAAGARAELAAILADIEAWVNRDSPSGHLELLDPLAAALARSCEAAGMRSELIPAGAGLHLHAYLEGEGESRVALLCHHDTVFPPGTAAKRPFARQGERAFGPGVADMKGGIAVGMHAVRLLAEHTRAFGRIELVSVPDEEPRSGAFATLDRLRGFDAALCLECGRPGGAIVTNRKGAVWLTVEATGRAAHAGVEPESGSNAIVALCREAIRISALSGSRPGLSVELTGFAGGETTNTVAAGARLTMDVRAWTEDELATAAAAAGAFGGHPGVTFELAKTAATPPLEETSASAELAARAAGISEALGAPLAEVSTGGVSDGCWTAAAGVPTLDGIGPVGALDHTADEYIEIDSIAPRCGIVAGLVCEVEGGRR